MVVLRFTLIPAIKCIKTPNIYTAVLQRYRLKHCSTWSFLAKIWLDPDVSGYAGVIFNLFSPCFVFIFFL